MTPKLLIVYGLFLATTYLFVGLGFELAKYISRRLREGGSSTSRLTRLTLAGVLLGLFQSIVVLTLLATWQLAPESTIGQTMSSPAGFALSAILTMLIFTGGTVILESLGFPIFVKPSRPDGQR